jgi:hypothetical protein
MADALKTKARLGERATLPILCGQEIEMLPAHVTALSQWDSRILTWGTILTNLAWYTLLIGETSDEATHCNYVVTQFLESSFLPRIEINLTQGRETVFVYFGNCFWILLWTRFLISVENGKAHSSLEILLIWQFIGGFCISFVGPSRAISKTISLVIPLYI